VQAAKSNNLRVGSGKLVKKGWRWLGIRKKTGVQKGMKKKKGVQKKKDESFWMQGGEGGTRGKKVRDRAGTVKEGQEKIKQGFGLGAFPGGGNRGR